MDKRNMKIDVINRCLRNCTNSWYWATCNAIPEQKFINACRTYAGNVEYGEVIGIIDETLFGSGKKGMLFTFDGVYYSTSQGGEYYPYKKLCQFENRIGYNCLALNDMLKKLYNIEIYDSEVAPSGWKILGDIVGGTLDLLSEISEQANKQSANQQQNIQSNEQVNYNQETRNEVKAIGDYIEVQYENNDSKETVSDDMNTEEMIKSLEMMKTFLKDINVNMIGGNIDKGISTQQEFFSYLYEITRLTATLSGDLELVNNDMFSKETKEKILEDKKSMELGFQLIEELMNTDVVNDIEVEKISIMNTVKLFTHRIKVALEEFYDENNYEELYEDSQKALKDLKSSLKTMIKYCNMFIEKIYSDNY